MADGARVRAFDRVARRTHTGTALGWSTPTPRVLTTRGDTVVVGADHELSVSAGRTGHRAWQGALLGWLVLSEAVTPLQAIGGLVILAGIWVARPREAKA